MIQQYSPKPPREVIPDWAVMVATLLLIAGLVAIMVMTAYFR